MTSLETAGGTGVTAEARRRRERTGQELPSDSVPGVNASFWVPIGSPLDFWLLALPPPPPSLPTVPHRLYGPHRHLPKGLI